MPASTSCIYCLRHPSRPAPVLTLRMSLGRSGAGRLPRCPGVRDPDSGSYWSGPKDRVPAKTTRPRRLARGGGGGGRGGRMARLLGSRTTGWRTPPTSMRMRPVPVGVRGAPGLGPTLPPPPLLILRQACPVQLDRPSMAYSAHRGLGLPCSACTCPALPCPVHPLPVPPLPPPAHCPYPFPNPSYRHVALRVAPTLRALLYVRLLCSRHPLSLLPSLPLVPLSLHFSSFVPITLGASVNLNLRGRR